MYAPTTVSSYIRSVAEFAQHFNKPPDQLGAEEVRSWQLFLLNEKRVKLSTYIQAICALRFFCRNIRNGASPAWRTICSGNLPNCRYTAAAYSIIRSANVAS